jgi:hypothetical protein
VVNLARIPMLPSTRMHSISNEEVEVMEVMR